MRIISVGVGAICYLTAVCNAVLPRCADNITYVGKLYTERRDVYRRVQATSTRGCALFCYNNPFCRSVAVSEDKGSGGKICELSYDARCTDETLASAPVDQLPVYLTCLRCISPERPAGGQRDDDLAYCGRVDQTQAPAGTSTTTSASVPLVTSSTTTHEQEPKVNASAEEAGDHLGPISFVDLDLYHLMGPVGNGTIEIIGGHNAIGQQFGNVEDVNGALNCSYERHPGMSPRSRDSRVPLDPAVPTIVGHAQGDFLDEAHCVKLCGAHSSCDGAEYIENSTHKLCYLFGEPSVLYRLQPPENATSAYLNGIKCRAVCKYNFTFLGGSVYQQFKTMALSGALGDLVVGRSFHECAELCSFFPSCAASLYEMTHITCVFLNASQLADIEAASRTQRLLPSEETNPEITGSPRFYLVTSVDCTTLPWIEQEKFETMAHVRKCNYDADLNIDTAWISALGGQNYTAAFRSADTEKKCAYACTLQDGQCRSALYAANSSNLLAISPYFARTFANLRPHCILMGLASSDMDYATAADVKPDPSLKSAPDVTLISNITKCDKVRPVQFCDYVERRGSFSTPTQPSLVFRSLGADSCRMSCFRLPHCHIARFFTRTNLRTYRPEPACEGYSKKQFVNFVDDAQSSLMFFTELKCY